MRPAFQPQRALRERVPPRRLLWLPTLRLLPLSPSRFCLSSPTAASLFSTSSTASASVHPRNPKYHPKRSSRATSNSTIPSRSTFHRAAIPFGLFSSRTIPIPAAPYTHRKSSPIRFFLFEKPSPRISLPTCHRQQESLQHLASPGFITRRFYPSMMNHVQIITAPTADTPGTCLLVHHDNRRYLFGNIAEGTQRVFVQQKVSLGRVEEVFLTGPISWHSAGGLLGMILTLAEVVGSARVAAAEEAAQKAARKNPSSGSSEAAAAAAAAASASVAPRSLSIHGGINLTHLLATARRFIFRKGLPIRPREVREDTSTTASSSEGNADVLRNPDWSDDNIMVWYAPVFAPGAGTSGRPPSSSRKRSHDDMEKDKEPAFPPKPEQEMADRQFLDSVVTHMFDSDWALDQLVETTLHAVQLPAKIFVKDEKTHHLKAYTGPYPDQDPDVPDIPVLVRKPWPGALIQALPRTLPVRQSMCYIVRNLPRRGKVDAHAAARLGVPKPMIRQLVSGENVTLADGRVVTPEMVIGAPTEGAAFAVADLPDTSYIDAFLARPEWSNTPLMSAINTIFWILGPDVVRDTRLQAFMQKHAGIRHTVASRDVCANQLALSSAAALQVKHNRIDPDRFPLQQYNNLAAGSQAPVAADSLSSTGSERTRSPPLSPRPALFEPARPGWGVRLAPRILEEDSKIFPIVDLPKAVREMDPQVLELADAARASVADPAFQAAAAAANQNLPHPDTEVIPLGTGSAMPSKYRNVSATLVRVPGVGSYLFDCGENTLGSMRRMLGDEKLAEVLRELRVLFISHLHADHHLGTVSVIRAWRDATAQAASTSGTVDAALPRLAVAAHSSMHQWLREYADVEDYGLDRIRGIELGRNLADGSGHASIAAAHPQICEPFIFSPGEAAEFGLQRIDACRVEHCYGALATVFTWTTPTTAGGAEPPLKVAYSGDCRPSLGFAALGKGATLLVHESTFDDELSGEALAKKHSTMGEALQIGREMGARRVLLTHFSQRYPKIPLFSSTERRPSKAAEDEQQPQQHEDLSPAEKEMQVLVAFDQMRVRLRDFRTAAAFLPALQKLYNEEERA